MGTSSGGITSVAIKDIDTGIRAGVELVDGKNRLLTSSIVTVEEIFGQDPFPDTYFTINNAGVLNDTLRIQIAATTNDPSTPDRDAPAVDVTVTVTASEAGDEEKFRDLVISTLNADGNFSSSLKAQKVKDNAIVHITSKFRGDFWERPGAGSVVLTPSGSVAVTLAFDTIIQRGKATSLDRDPDSPHNLGILGVAGSVSINPGALSNRFIEDLKTTGGSNALNVNGSVTPVSFRLVSDSVFDLFVTELRIHGTGNGIKFGQFLSLNSKLTNGITWSVKSDDLPVQISTLKATGDIKSRFASKGGWDLDIQAGGDHVLAVLEFGVTPIVIKKSGTFAVNDEIKVTVNDNLTQITELFVTAIGFKKEP